jgi:hypothetical protein
MRIFTYSSFVLLVVLFTCQNCFPFQVFPKMGGRVLLCSAQQVQPSLSIDKASSLQNHVPKTPTLDATVHTVPEKEVTIQDVLQEKSSEEQVLQLPAPRTSHNEEGTDSDRGSKGTRKIEVNGASVGLDDIGPIIVNLDGTLRRIENWSQLSKQEQMGTMRMVARRNKKRLAALRELQEHEGEGEEEEETEENGVLGQAQKGEQTPVENVRNRPEDGGNID